MGGGSAWTLGQVGRRCIHYIPTHQEGVANLPHDFQHKKCYTAQPPICVTRTKQWMLGTFPSAANSCWRVLLQFLLELQSLDGAKRNISLDLQLRVLKKATAQSWNLDPPQKWTARLRTLNEKYCSHYSTWLSLQSKWEVLQLQTKTNFAFRSMISKIYMRVSLARWNPPRVKRSSGIIWPNDYQTVRYSWIMSIKP